MAGRMIRDVLHELGPIRILIAIVIIAVVIIVIRMRL